MPETTYIKAITSTLAAAMRADERVFVVGEDVAEAGPYTATAGLAEEFGTARVINTPISEAAITGVAIGAAQSGMRPVLEIMFIDFITLALDQLVNAAAKAHFMSGGQLTVPLVLRTQGGAGQRGAAQHSQSLESWLTHVPGLKVVMPSRPVDAAGLLRSAIADPNPVVFIENKTLYFRKGELPEPAPVVPIGEAATLREGRDVTVVALSRLVHDALAAADRLARDGIEVEVIDPRTLVPLDLRAIVASVERTGRLVVAHEAVEQPTGGARWGVGDRHHPVAAQTDPVALPHRAGVGAGVAHRPGHLAGDDPGGRRRHRLDVGFGVRRRVVGQERREALHDRLGGDHPHRLRAELVHLLGDRADVLVVGQDHDLLGVEGIDDLQDLRSRRVHGLPARDQVVDAERPEDPPDALAGHDCDHVCGGDRAEPLLERGVARVLADPPLFFDLVGQVGDPDVAGPAAVERRLDRRSDVVGVDMAVPGAVAADHDDRVADAGPHLLEGGDGVVGGM